jgi:hypothetical protein
MKSLDILVLCKLLTLEKRGTEWSYKSLAEEVFLSASETHASVKRLTISGVFDPDTKKVIRSSMLELLIYGVRYVFPAEKGPATRGMETAHSAPVLNQIISHSSDDKYVWPYAKGKARGISINPLAKNVPQAAEKDHELYDLLALIDALRAGKAREKKIAAEMLYELIGKDK